MAFDRMLDGLLAAPAAPLVPNAGRAVQRTGLAQSLHYLSVGLLPRVAVRLSPLLARAASAGPASLRSSGEVLAQAAGARPWGLAEYPRPADDNGRGIHWIPTTSQPPDVVDRFVERAQALNLRWVTFLNSPTDVESNDYLVRRLREAGIMPVMRIYTDGGAPIQEDITPMVRHYRRLGVSYFQLFNEPNLSVENSGRAPDVDRYLAAWIPAAQQVLRGGGLPGFGALSPQGDVDDLAFLRNALEGLKARGAANLLDRGWLSVHNYGLDHLRVREYDRIAREELGRSLPQIGTEAGVYAGGELSVEDQIRAVTGAYRYLDRREPYYFAYSLWCIGNEAGGGHDARWEHQALYRTDGATPLAQALEQTL